MRFYARISVLAPNFGPQISTLFPVWLWQIPTILNLNYHYNPCAHSPNWHSLLYFRLLGISLMFGGELHSTFKGMLIIFYSVFSSCLAAEECWSFLVLSIAGNVKSCGSLVVSVNCLKAFRSFLYSWYSEILWCNLAWVYSLCFQ